MTLPEGWVDAAIGDIATVRTEKADPKTLGDMPFIGLEHIEPHTGRLLTQGFATDVRSAVIKFQRGDVLFSRLRPYLNKVIEAPFDGCASAEIIPFNPAEGVASSLLKRLMMSAEFLKFTASLDKGDRPRVDAAQVAGFNLLVPPSAEQLRIVAKLDTLTEHLARARTELDRAATLAKMLRHRAVESTLGKLEHPRAGWRSWKIQELLTEGPSNGWSPKSDTSAKGALTLKLTATTSGCLRLDDRAVKRIHEVPGEDSKFWLRNGDLLVQRANALEHIGSSAIYHGPEKTYIYPDLMMRLRLNNPVLTKLIWYRLNSPTGRKYLQARATGTAGNMPKISGSVIRDFPISLPNEADQNAIAERLDMAFARADRLEAEATRARALLDRLEAAILAKAFRGELVPQDPNDEPASVLLDRIRAERAAAPKPRRGRARKAVS